VDRYVSREKWPFEESATLYEIRLLTVLPSARKSLATAILLYASFRILETRGAARIIGMGRRELMGFYNSLGFISSVRRFRREPSTFTSWPR